MSDVDLIEAVTVLRDEVLDTVERAFREPADQMVVVEAATLVAVTVARVVSLAAVARASRDRAARLREVLEKQKAHIVRLENEQDFG